MAASRHTTGARQTPVEGPGRSTAAPGDVAAAPRWSPDRPLAERITRVGRWKRVDPTQPGRLWSWGRWMGFAGWVGLVAGTLLRAWQRSRSETPSGVGSLGGNGSAKEARKRRP